MEPFYQVIPIKTLKLFEKGLVMQHFHILEDFPFGDMDPSTLITNAERIEIATTGTVKDDPYIKEEFVDLKKNCIMMEDFLKKENQASSLQI